MTRVDAVAHDGGGLGQLRAGVHAEAFGRVLRSKRRDDAPLVAADLQRVGQIELTLRVIGATFESAANSALASKQ